MRVERRATAYPALVAMACVRCCLGHVGRFMPHPDGTPLGGGAGGWHPTQLAPAPPQTSSHSAPPPESKAATTVAAHSAGVSPAEPPSMDENVAANALGAGVNASVGALGTAAGKTQNPHVASAIDSAKLAFHHMQVAQQAYARTKAHARAIMDTANELDDTSGKVKYLYTPPGAQEAIEGFDTGAKALEGVGEDLGDGTKKLHSELGGATAVGGAAAAMLLSLLPLLLGTV